MDVKLKCQSCNCVPSEIEGYGRYAWTMGSYDKLKNIPRLPEELFEMIRGPTNTPATATIRPRTTPTAWQPRKPPGQLQQRNSKVALKHGHGAESVSISHSGSRTFLLPTLLFVELLQRQPSFTIAAESISRNAIAAGPRGWHTTEDR